jgi:hypothetical protein
MKWGSSFLRGKLYYKTKTSSNISKPAASHMLDVVDYILMIVG